MNTNIGIDIGKKRCDVCVMDGRSRVLERTQYENTSKEAGEFAALMAKKYKKHNSDRCRAVCETTANMWIMTYDAFEEAGIDIRLANTLKLAAIAKTGKKTDKIDAERLANILRAGMVPECYVPPRTVRGTRTMIRQRVRTVQDRTRTINRIHSLLDTHGIVIDAAQMHSKKALEQLWAVNLKTVQEEMVLKQHVMHVRHLNEMITMYNEHLGQEAAKNQYAVLLASMPGVGPFIALLLASEISDINRFASPKQMVSWAGLCPTVHQSGDRMYMGRIKKIDTNSLVNWALCEAANTAIRHDMRMKAVYESAKLRHSNKHTLAIIVVANKMANIMWHMLTTGTPYEYRNQESYQRKLDKMAARSRK